MKKIVVIILLLIVLSGCSAKPSSYPFDHQNEPIVSIDLLYYPWIEDETQPFMVFQLIRSLESEEVPIFMDALYALETKRARPTPPGNYGQYIARVSYENGDMEYFGTRHIELVKSGEKAYAVGYYYFPGDAFEKLFLEYAGDISQLKENTWK